MTKQTLSAATLNKAIDQYPELEPFREMLQERLFTSPDEVRLTFDELTDSDFLPSVQFALELDDTLRAVAYTSTFGDSEVYKIIGAMRPDLKAKYPRLFVYNATLPQTEELQFT